MENNFWHCDKALNSFSSPSHPNDNSPTIYYENASGQQCNLSVVHFRAFPKSTSVSHWFTDFTYPDEGMLRPSSKLPSPATILSSPSKTLKRSQLSPLLLPKINKEDYGENGDDACDYNDEHALRHPWWNKENSPSNSSQSHFHGETLNNSRKRHHHGDLVCRRLKPKFSGHLNILGKSGDNKFVDLAIELDSTYDDDIFPHVQSLD
jgi:hypothetical protein